MEIPDKVNTDPIIYPNVATYSSPLYTSITALSLLIKAQGQKSKFLPWTILFSLFKAKIEEQASNSITVEISYIKLANNIFYHYKSNILAIPFISSTNSVY